MTRLIAWIGVLVAALIGLHAATFPTDDAVAVAFNGVRLLAIALGWWLLVTTGLGLVARTLQLRRVVRLTDLVTTRLVRRMLDGVASVAVVVAVTAPGAAMAQNAPSSPPPVMHVIDDAPPAPAASPPAPAPASAPGPATYEVRPGDCMWDIAGRLLSARLGRPATDAEVVPAFHALIAANADVPDPDLILSGQVLRVPDASVQPQSAISRVTLPRTD